MESGELKSKFEVSFKRIQDAFVMVTGKESLSLSHVLGRNQLDTEEVDFEEGAVFGFNVRLKSDDMIIPILGGTPWNTCVKKSGLKGTNSVKDVELRIVSEIKPELVIPRIFNTWDDNTVSFCLNENDEVEDVDDFVICEDIKHLIQYKASGDNKASFAIVQKRNLFKQNDRVYFWISRECKSLDFRDRMDNPYLSNILVISKEKRHIDFVKRRHIDFIRFLFQLEMAYAVLLERSKRVESIKSAVAAIMSRNMSHNLGSHYLYYTKNQLASLADGFEEAGPEIRGAAKVLGYMQARMDYLATIVSGDKYPYGAVFFKGQIFDELTIDDFSKRHFNNEIDEISGKNKIYKRTTNYLLQNLVLSENFSRTPVLEDKDGKLKDGIKRIRLQIKYNGGTFTGVKENEKRENKTKLSISKLCIALPGGVMSIHAFYNVIENLIRNSAKYQKGDFKEELVFTIRINELPADSERNLPVRYEFVLFDNKANALKPCSSEDPTPLVDKMNSELCQLKILTENNELDKSNKGLKEMLFSTLWMCAFTYEESKHMSDVLAEVDLLSGKEKMDKNRQHAFEYVAVSEEGDIKENGSELNLGIRFELPKYCMMENVHARELGDNLIEKGLNNFTDILCVDPKYDKIDSLRKQFTRIHEGFVNNVNDEKEAVSIYKEILKSRFPDFDNYLLIMDTKGEKGASNSKLKQRIFFKTHAADLSEMRKYAYCESISGGNFTKTLYNLFVAGFNCWGNYKDCSSEFFALKIKEAALTRITLIDERFFNDMLTHEKTKEYLSLKNIRVLSLRSQIDECIEKDGRSMSFCDLFEGNEFCDEKNATHFLSIHLGMIEKIVKDDSKWVKAFKMESEPTDARVTLFMKKIKESFRPEIGEVFISIHSGRGNFSPELDDSLQAYPFISVSALESTYTNSKFLLAQLFYNTVYIGKGVTNAGK